jgi:tetratricopeptide (TPR) repeat protein
MRFGTGLLAGIALISCAEPPQELTCDERLAAVESRAASIFSDPATPADSLRVVARVYADFANSCHDHPQAPEILFRRADVLLGLGKFHEAQALFRDVHDNFGIYERRSACAFYVAFIYDVHLGDRMRAIKAYNEVLELHPSSAESEWARQALIALGEVAPPSTVKSPADLLLLPADS